MSTSRVSPGRADAASSTNPAAACRAAESGPKRGSKSTSTAAVASVLPVPSASRTKASGCRAAAVERPRRAPRAAARAGRRAAPRRRPPRRRGRARHRGGSPPRGRARPPRRSGSCTNSAPPASVGVVAHHDHSGDRRGAERGGDRVERECPGEHCARVVGHGRREAALRRGSALDGDHDGPRHGGVRIPRGRHRRHDLPRRAPTPTALGRLDALTRAARAARRDRTRRGTRPGCAPRCAGRCGRSRGRGAAGCRRGARRDRTRRPCGR